MGRHITPHHIHARRRSIGVVFAFIALGLAACGGDDESAGSEAATATARVEAQDAAGGDQFIDDATAEAAAEATAAEAADVGATAATVPGGDSGGIDPSAIETGSIGRDLIVEMYVLLSSDDIRRTVSSVTARAAALGGGLASSDVNFGAGQNPAQENTGSAVLVVKVPPDQVATMLDGLADTGTVQSIQQSAQDVTEQLVDLQVRIDNARASVASVRDFMTKTTNLTELVTLEAELTRRQTDLEQLEAQQRNLGDRVALATITIEVVPTASVPEPPAPDEDPGIGDAFAKGWNAFVAVLFAFAFVLAVLAPFIVVGAIVGAVVWLLVRTQKRRATASTAAVREPDRIPVEVGD